MQNIKEGGEINGVYVYDPDLAVESKNAMAYYKRTYGAKRGWYRK